MPLGTPDPSERIGLPLLPVRLGGWALELRGDEVADISFAQTPLLRAVRPVVRDQDWNTVPVHVVDRRTTRVGDATVVATDLLFAAATIRYRGTLTVTVSPLDLVVDFAGEASTAFLRNRIGLVVLHRADEAGRPVEVVSSAGVTIRGRWPEDISPHQPFRDVLGFRWSTQGVDAELHLTGDVFETEDQRNWTDYSFKTYSTSLDEPFPVQVIAGNRVHQSARLTASTHDPRRPLPGAARPSTGAVDTEVSRWEPPAGPEQVHVGPATSADVPSLALGASLYPPPAHLVASSGGYDAVLVELVGTPDGWPALLQAAEQQALALDAGLDVRLVTADPDEARRTVHLLPDGVVRLGAFDPVDHVTAAAVWEALADEAERSGYRGELVGGTRAHFTELNRRFHELPAGLPALAFSLTPQMHATELPHLIDSLAGQRLVVQNAVRLAGGRALHVGPVTLARRFNAVATSGTGDPSREARAADDPLQPTGFTAVWALGSIAALSAPGVSSACYFESNGPRGIADETGSPYPVKGVLDLVAGLRGRRVLESTGPAHLVTYAVEGAGGSIDLLVGNLSPHDRRAVLDLGGAAAIEAGIPAWSVLHLALGPDRSTIVHDRLVR